jgi:hypothetical protein
MRARTFAAGLAVAAAAAGTWLAPGVAATAELAGRVPARQTLATGLTYDRIVDGRGPWIIHVLTVDPSKAVTIDIATAGGAMGTYARPSSIAATHGALAAINGDFTISPGRPLHPFAEDGTLKTTGLQTGSSFAISHDETSSFVGPQRVQIVGRNLARKRSFEVHEMNTGRPTGGDIVAFTSYGGSAEKPPKNACSVRLKMAGKLTWAKGKLGVYRDLAVVRRVCRATALPVKPSTTVLSSRLTGSGATVIKAMRKGQLIRLKWSFGWADVMDSVGGMPTLVANGVPYDPPSCSSYFCSRNPRSGLGVTATGDVLLVTVDGRKSSSVGMTLPQFARLFVDLGARWALNLDGGGGATMWTKAGGIMNDPTDSTGERPVTNAVLVLPGKDRSEPVPRLRRLAYPVATRAQAIQAQEAAEADPGSVGGLLDMLGG